MLFRSRFFPVVISFILTACAVIVNSEYTCNGQDLTTTFTRLLRLEKEFEEKTLELERELQGMRISTKSDLQHQTEVWDQKLSMLENSTKAQINDLNVSLQTSVSEISSLLDREITTLNTTLQDQSNDLETFKDTQGIPGVSFVVRQKDVHSTCSNPLAFSTVVENKGNGFNNDTNIFTAPYAGFYFLSVQLCSHVNSAFDFAIQSGTYNKKYAASRNGITSDHTCTSVSAAVRLENQEQVYVNVTCPGTGSIEGHINDDFWTMFTGVLLHF